MLPKMNENQEISESTKKVIYSAKDDFGKTALHCAAENGFQFACKKLIQMTIEDHEDEFGK